MFGLQKALMACELTCLSTETHVLCSPMLFLIYLLCLSQWIVSLLKAGARPSTYFHFPIQPLVLVIPSTLTHYLRHKPWHIPGGKFTQVILLPIPLKSQHFLELVLLSTQISRNRILFGRLIFTALKEQSTKFLWNYVRTPSQNKYTSLENLIKLRRLMI